MPQELVNSRKVRGPPFKQYLQHSPVSVSPGGAWLWAPSGGSLFSALPESLSSSLSREVHLSLRLTPRAQNYLTEQ